MGNYTIAMSLSLGTALFCLAMSANAQIIIRPEEKYHDSEEYGHDLIKATPIYLSTDLTIGNGEFPSSINIARSYNKEREYNQSDDLLNFGNWDFKYSLSYNCVNCQSYINTNWPGSPVRYFQGYGSSAVFYQKSAGEWVNVYGDGSEYNLNGIVTLTNHSGGKIVYGMYDPIPADNPDEYPSDRSRVTMYIAPNGERLNYYYHVSADQEKKVSYSFIVNSRGFGVRLHSKMSKLGGQKVHQVDAISTKCLPTSASCSFDVLKSVSYEYNGGTRDGLSQFKDSDGNIEKYVYNSEGDRIVGILRPGRTRAYFSYRYEPNVTIFTDLSGSERKIEVDGFNRNFITSSGKRIYKFKPVFNIDEYESRLVEFIDENSNKTTYSHDEFGRINKIIFPEGNYRTLSRDNRSNITSDTYTSKPGTNLSDITTSFKFDLCTNNNRLICNSPSYKIDNGNSRTDYTWSSIHGGIEKIVRGLQPDGSCKKSDPCPEKTFEYTKYNGIDGSTFYLLTSEKENISNGKYIEVQYVYDEADHFNLKEKHLVSGTSKKYTCYKYDKIGNKIAEQNFDEGKSCAL